MIIATFVHIKQSPSGWLSCESVSPKYLKNPPEWRALLLLGGLAAVQYSPKYLIQCALSKDGQVQADCYLLLLSYATNTMCALQGRRGAGRLLPSPSELRHKYNVRSARTMRCRSTATFSFGATPQKILPSGERTSHPEA